MAVRCSSTIGIAIEVHRSSANRRRGRTTRPSTRPASPTGDRIPSLGASSYSTDDVPLSPGRRRASLRRPHFGKHEFSPVNHLEHEDFSRLVGALFGVAIGSAVALALACLIFPAPGEGYDAARHGTLDWARSWGRHEEREMAFFVFTLIFGGALGYVGAA